eukprot:jgi/Mesen1/6901/ME000353S05926
MGIELKMAELDHHGGGDVRFNDSAATSWASPLNHKASSILQYATEDLRSLYTLHEELGRGQFGLVRACVNNRTKERFACKTVEKRHLRSHVDVMELRREVEVLTKLSGQAHIVEVQGVYEDAESVHIVMELCRGGELFDEIVKRKRYNEQDAASVFRDIVAAVVKCHAKGVMHRDLKPENVLLVSKPREGEAHPAVKLADFGLAVFLDSRRRIHGVAGSPFYMAPEVLLGKYGQAADIWSLGVILYILLCGAPPFWGRTDAETFDAIVAGKIDMEGDVWKGVSPEAKCLVRRLLSADTRKRPTAPQILSHPWCQKFRAPAAGNDVSPHTHRTSRELERRKREASGNDAPEIPSPRKSTGAVPSHSSHGPETDASCPEETASSCLPSDLSSGAMETRTSFSFHTDLGRLGAKTELQRATSLAFSDGSDGSESSCYSPVQSPRGPLELAEKRAKSSDVTATAGSLGACMTA